MWTLAVPHNVKGSWFEVRTGFKLGLGVKVRGYLDVYEGSHKDRNTRLCLFRCV